MSNHWNLDRVNKEITCDPDTCVKWCEDNGLLPTRRICCDGHEMMITTYKTCLGQFQCSKRHAGGKAIRISRTRGTVFEFKRMCPEKVIIMMYCFANDVSYKDCILESSIDIGTTSKETVCEFYGFCRELITQYMLEMTMKSTEIGGEGKIVKIEELFLDKRKTNIGPYREGTDIVVMYDLDSAKFNTDVCPNSEWNADNLFPLIQRNVAKGSVIISDKCRDYTPLIECGYVIKNSESFLNNQVDIHKSHCQLLKQYQSALSNYGVDKFLEQLFKSFLRKENLDPFEAFLDVIRHKFPI